MDLLALDFETAAAQWDSPCELGITVVRAGRVEAVHNWLIKPRCWPYFSPWNVAVHGIRPTDVAQAPAFDVLWRSEVLPLIEGATVVAHNASFDMGVLRGTLASYGLPHPQFRYFCSVSMAKKAWPGMPRFDLKTLCSRNGIPLHHHRAGHDSAATAELVLRAAGPYREQPIDRFIAGVSLKTGHFYPGGHRTPGGKVTGAKP
ncbi:MAG TPA: 3'-5' exonuclease [Flavobacteriales bacterium]